MSIQIEECKKYLRRDGERTGEMKPNPDATYCWIDPASRRSYTEDGNYYAGAVPSSYDLIAEYHEPIPTIDEDKPIELMDRTTVVYGPHGMVAYDKVSGKPFSVVPDAQGCIGGVQVVRNRAEPKRYKGEFFRNLYPEGLLGCHDEKDSADLGASANRIACIRFTYDVKEGDGL